MWAGECREGGGGELGSGNFQHKRNKDLPSNPFFAPQAHSQDFSWGGGGVHTSRTGTKIINAMQVPKSQGS